MNEKAGEPWSEKEKEKLKKLAEKGLSYTKISKHFKRSVKAIRSRCWQKNIKVETNREPLGDKSNRKGRRFVRNTRKWEVENRILYGVLLAEKITIADLAEYLNVSTRSVQRWVYQKQKPNKENIEKICNVLNIPENVLFGEMAYKKSKINGNDNTKIKI